MATVACKLPNGVTIEHEGRTVTFNGANHPDAVLGFGLTHDVDADWFKSLTEGTEEKPAPFKNFAPIRNGTMFVAKDEREATDKARERANDVATGQEPLNAAAPMPGIEPTDEQRRENDKASAAPRRAR